MPAAAGAGPPHLWGILARRARGSLYPVDLSLWVGSRLGRRKAGLQVARANVPASNNCLNAGLFGGEGGHPVQVNC